jgi:hypothetical protein
MKSGDSSLFCNIKDGSSKASDGKSYSTTGVQGMNVGEKYIYSAKIHYNKPDVKNKIIAVSIFRTDITTKKTKEMICSKCYNTGHANDILTIIDKKNVKHLLITTGKK